jgi:hypothetical protein
MKKVTILFLTFFMLISFASCGQKQQKVEPKKVQKDLSNTARLPSPPVVSGAWKQYLKV